MKILLSAATSKGRIRNENQDIIYAGDTIISDEDTYHKTIHDTIITIAIADGMGGHMNGRLAAETAIKNIHRNKNKKNMNDIIIQINNELGALNYGKNIRECMGTTLSLIKIKNNIMYWSSVGDSSIYIINKDFIRRVNRLDEVLDRYGTRTGVIDNCLGATKKIEPINIHSGEEVIKDNFICLCISDGVSSFLTDKEIHKLVIHENISNVCSRIIETSISAKSNDNISAIIAKYEK